MKTKIIFGLLAIFLLQPGSIWAENKTPTNSYGVVIFPVQWDLGDRPEAKTALNNEGYTVSSYVSSSCSCSPSVGISDIMPQFSLSAGGMLINSHATATGFLGEAYNYTANGLAARDSAYAYIASYYSAAIFKVNVLNKCYGIGIKFTTPAALAGGIFHCQTCYGKNMVASGGGVSYGPSGECTISDSQSNVKTLWETLEGKNGFYYRSSGQAYQECPNLFKNGADNITLTPVVNGFSHESGTQVPSTGLTVAATFDTPVSTAMSAIMCVMATGGVTVESASWRSSTRLEATLKPGLPGSGYFTIQGANIASANCPLLFANGGDNYSVRLVNGDNPAASVSGFSVVSGLAEWKVASEDQTQEYLVEGATTSNGPWTLVVTEAKGSGRHQVNVSGGYAYYRLVEVENTGNKVMHGLAKPSQRQEVPAENPPTVAFLREKIAKQQAERQARGQTSVQSIGTGKKYLIFTVPALAEAAQIVADFARYYGYTARVKTTAGYPSSVEAFRQTLHDSIRAAASVGDVIHFIGDASDVNEFAGPPSAWLWGRNGWPGIKSGYLAAGYPSVGQPEKNLLPTWAVPDTLPRSMNTAWVTPYLFTEVPFADLDDDGIPDVVIARWPVTTENEVLALACKMQAYNQDFLGGPYQVSFYVSDLDFWGNGDGARTKAAADNTEASLPAGQHVSRLYQSQVPVDAERVTAAVNLWNNQRPELVVMYGSGSNRSWPANFFDQTLIDNPFHMGMITPWGNQTPVVIVASCDAADFCRTEDPDYGSPVGHKMLVAWDKGAVVWIGPSCGSWQHANEIIGRYLVEEIFHDLNRPVAEGYLRAMRRVFTDYADCEEVLRTARLWMFLGDPLSRLNKVQSITAVEEKETPDILSLEQNYPNPFNPATRIAFNLPQSELVWLTVYDVAGAKIAILVDKVLPAGRHAIDWNGRNESGKTVASGMYFYRLTIKEKSLSRKMILLK